MNPSITKGWNYFRNIKPSTPVTKDWLIFQFHRWQDMVLEELKKEGITEPQGADLIKLCKKLF